MNKSTAQQKTINAVKEAFRVFGTSVFHYTKFKLVLEKFHTTQALISFLVTTDVVEKTSKGFYRFKRKPTETDCINVYKANLASVKASYFRRKAKREAIMPAEPVQEEPKQKLQPINEQICIDYLKSKGNYRIIKLVTTEQEV